VTSSLPVTQAISTLYQFEYDPLKFALDNHFPVQTLLCERELILQAGGFDEQLRMLEDWDLWLRVFEIKAPVHVRRITGEIRIRADGSNMSSQDPSLLSETRGHVYGKSLAQEQRMPRLREQRIAHLIELASHHGQPFPEQALAWLNGAPGLSPIDPQKLRLRYPAAWAVPDTVD